ncbi:glucosamine kinase [Palleronia salina]|uniref:Glucosamine kinase n=1 Tax=Palleronia salina TaxID=313368 RepID=A0A1M6L782_9RHOB|nr:BadF/BadG/BcrA/BcrD ATPase family protein [Palleronia salina]SHJ67042.1 glucosamine kinase [Palleronia salina]
MDDDTPSYFVGVDGGGSGCRAVIADAMGHVLGRGDAGPANATTDLVLATLHAADAVYQAVSAAGLERDVLASTTAHVGLAGIMDLPMARQVAADLPFRARVSDDRRTFVAGALGDTRGVLIGLGTGTIAARWDGRKARFIGGYGLQVSDQASGAWLGRAALSEALLAHDGLRPGSELGEQLMTRMGGDPGGIVAFAARATPADYAALAPLVVTAAGAQDDIACDLMRRGADYIDRAVRAFGIPRGGVLCLAGGVGPHYTGWLADDLRAVLAPPRGSALDGALSLAMAQAR